VKPGEYLGRIATQYGVTVASIEQQNKLTSSVVKVGQKLTITTNKPVAVAAKPQSQPLRRYTVQRGDFLGKIARQFNVSVEALRSTNKLKSDQLSVNQVLTIPSE
jgi:N-acetylmuramoyl-L-alanine amidase